MTARLLRALVGLSDCAREAYCAAEDDLEMRAELHKLGIVVAALIHRVATGAATATTESTESVS